MNQQLLTQGTGTRRPDRRCSCLAILLALILVLFGGQPAGARGQVTFDEALGAVRDAGRALEHKIGLLPRQAQLEVGTDAHFLARSAERTLQRLARQPLAAASAGLEEDLLLLRDLMVAVATELDQTAGPSEADIERLIGLAEERVAGIERALERRIGAVAGSVVSAERTAEGLVLNTVDRTLYGAIRLAGAGLFLIGLLVVGLRLLSLSEAELSVADLVRQTPVAAVGGMVAIGLFLGASLTLTVDPRPVAALAQRAELRAAPAACERLAIQREQLLDARTIGHDGLGDRIKDRMRPAAQDCLGLDSQVAAVEAVEWLSTSLDPFADRRPGRAADRRGPGPVEAEIERLMAAVEELTEGAGPGDPEQAAGGPIEALTEAEAPVASGRVVETTTRVNYRSGPSTAAGRLGTLSPGAEVVLLGERGDWANIQLDDGRSVYVASAYLRDVR